MQNLNIFHFSKTWAEAFGRYYTANTFLQEAEVPPLFLDTSRNKNYPGNKKTCEFQLRNQKHDHNVLDQALGKKSTQTQRVLGLYFGF